jgi:hypothetical protein
MRAAHTAGVDPSRSTPDPHNLVLCPCVCSTADAHKANNEPRFHLLEVLLLSRQCGGDRQRDLRRVRVPAKGYGVQVQAAAPARNVCSTERQRRHRSYAVLLPW